MTKDKLKAYQRKEDLKFILQLAFVLILVLLCCIYVIFATWVLFFGPCAVPVSEMPGWCFFLMRGK